MHRCACLPLIRDPLMWTPFIEPWSCDKAVLGWIISLRPYLHKQGGGITSGTGIRYTLKGLHLQVGVIAKVVTSTKHSSSYKHTKAWERLVFVDRVDPKYKQLKSIWFNMYIFLITSATYLVPSLSVIERWPTPINAMFHFFEWPHAICSQGSRSFVESAKSPNAPQCFGD